ncbi:VapE domain-containing protein [Epilithonimonas sp.]|uniref:VapE domain-containing protein n=1 Tax=Epilithonimonas sp. TaxID=2894511 RepID=UPI0035B4F1E6
MYNTHFKSKIPRFNAKIKATFNYLDKLLIIFKNLKNMKHLHKTQEYLNTNYNFRYNEITSKIEFATLETNQFTEMTDRDFNSILVALAKEKISISQNDLRIIINSDLTVSYNPIKEYFKSLPEIKGTENIKRLFATLKTHDDEFFEWAFTKWLVAWVACMLEDTVNQQCIILAGTQGIGKSTWVEYLVPKELKPYYYGGNIKLGNKDTLGLLSEKCLINLDELASMTYSNVTELKELVTKGNITFRRPYGQNTQIFPRRASFIGSVNGTEFLYDLTGNRRFLSFEATYFENKGRHDVDMNLVLAEIYNLYKNDFQYWFDDKDQQLIERNNERFLVQTYEEASLRAKFAPIPFKQYNSVLYVAMKLVEIREKEHQYRFLERKERVEKELLELDNPSWLRIDDIVERCMKRGHVKGKGDLIKFGRLLNKMGFQSKRDKKGTLYQVYNIDVRNILRDTDVDQKEFLYWYNRRIMDHEM